MRSKEKTMEARSYINYETILELRKDFIARKEITSRPISRVLSWAVIHLRCSSPNTCSGLPGSGADNTIGSLFGLAPGGVYLATACYHVVRCALTAPFHPYRPSTEVDGVGGLLSAALSVGSHPPGVTWHPVLRSPDFPPRTLEGVRSDCLADSRRQHSSASSVALVFNGVVVQFTARSAREFRSDACGLCG